MYGGIEEKSAVSGVPTPSSYKSFDEFWSQIANTVEYSAAQGIPLLTSDAWETEQRGFGVCNELYSNETMIKPTGNKLNRDDPAFQKIMKTAFGASGYFDRPKTVNSNQLDTELQYINSGEACVSITYELGIMSLYYMMNQSKFVIGSSAVDGVTPYIRAVPSYGDLAKTTAMITLAMGVSESCKDKQAAYDFIKSCMDDATLMNSICTSQNNSYGISVPVSRKLLSEKVTDAAQSYVSSNPYKVSGINEITDVLLSDLTNIDKALPYYVPLNMIFYRRFREVYESNPDHSDPDALIDEMCDAIDKDLQTFFAS